MDDDNLPLTVTEIREKMISSFMKDTSSSREEAKSFLETHQWDLFAAVSAFTEHNVYDAAHLLATIVARTRSKRAADTPCESERTKRRELAGNKPTLGGSNDGGEQSDDVDEKDEESDVERPGKSSSRIVSAEPQMVITFFVTMWRNGYTVDDGPLHTSDNPRDATLIETIQELESPRDLNPEDNQVRLRVKLIRRQEEDFNESPNPSTDDVDDEDKESDAERPVKYSARIVSDDEPHEVVMFIVTMWRNGFTFDDGPLHTLDNTQHATFIEIVERLESPRDLNPQDDGTRFRIKLITRQDEDFIEPPNPNTLTPFQGVGRILGATEPAASSESLTTTPQPSMSLVVDPAAPTTWIQLRLADGTRIFSRFNSHDTVRDIRGFMDACRPGGSSDYQLLVGFPPNPEF